MSLRGSPINVEDIGNVHSKTGRMGSIDQDLLRVETMLKGATIFIFIAREEGRWPFRIDNLTQVDVAVYQNVPFYFLYA